MGRAAAGDGWTMRLRAATAPSVPLLAACGALALALRARERTTRRRTEGLLGVARALVETEDPREGFTRAAAQATEAQWALLLEPEAGGRRLHLRAVAGPGELRLLPVAVGGEPSPAGQAFTSGERVVVADARTDGRVPPSIVEATGAVTFLAQPVRRGGRVIGVLVLVWQRRVKPSGDVLSLVELLSASAALAIERSQLLARAEHAARTDPLTGLANRRVWDRALPRELARAARQSTPLSVAMLDLDHFKTFNDTHGHQAGDRLLREAARAWADELRATDLLVRYGGEEFALLLPGTPLLAAVEVVDRLRVATPERQTASAGVAMWDGEETAEALLARADRALYGAKAAGRDRTRVDDREARRRLARRLGAGPEPGVERRTA